MGEYQASTADRELQIINLNLLEQQAAKVIPPGAFGYIQGGAGDEYTMRENQEAFKCKAIVPRVLADLEHPDLRTSILGTEISGPIIMAPSAAHGLAHVLGEVPLPRRWARWAPLWVSALMPIPPLSKPRPPLTGRRSGSSFI